MSVTDEGFECGPPNPTVSMTSVILIACLCIAWWVSTWSNTSLDVALKVYFIQEQDLNLKTFSKENHPP